MVTDMNMYVYTNIKLCEKQIWKAESILKHWFNDCLKFGSLS